ncbi:MAG TPA: MFS transporter [Steroidobacteraceae bacterium]|nr:MFS transporter [Steroidobacteraceae bacterium]
MVKNAVSPAARVTLATATSRTVIRRYYPWYVLALLLCVYSVNWMDRYVLVIILEPIKRDLRLSDTALGLLSGFAFALVYSLAGIPIARWADRGTRRSLISLGLVIWSLMTGLSGFAATFAQLTVARFGVALGESACSPPASSLIADYFPAHRRATAFAVYGVGISIGIALGLAVGGWANEVYGWRVAFMIAGLPGLILAVAVRYTIREPRRGQTEELSADTTFYSVTDTLRIILSRKSFLAAAIGIGLFSFSGNAFETWTPVYLMRLYHMNTGTIGAWMGPIEGVGGIIGTMAGGLLADRLGRHDIRWYLWMPATAAGVMVLSMWVFLHTNNSQTSMFVSYFATILFSSSFMAPVVAISQRIIPVRMRALATALLYLLLNLIGPGAGPVVAGILNDALVGAYGVEAIRVSLTATLLGALGGIAFMLYAARQLPCDLHIAASRAAPLATAAT